MLTIGNNVMAIKTYNNLRRAGAQMQSAMQKTSSGYRINTAADSPADLVESEKLRARIAGLEKSIRNVRTNANVLDIADGALGEVQGLISRMRELAIHSQNSGIASADQIAANQSEMDAGLQAIDRILGTTSYAGQKLLSNFAHTGLGQGASVILRDADITREFNNLQSGGGLDLAGYLKNREEAGELTLSMAKTDAFDENGLLLEDRKIVVHGSSGDPDAVVILTFAAGAGIDEIAAALRQRTFTQEEREGLDSDYVPPGERFSLEAGRVDFSLDDLAYFQGLGDDAAAGFLADSLESVRVVAFDKAGGAEGAGGVRLTEAERKLVELGNALLDLSMGGLGSTAVFAGYDENGVEIYKSYSLSDLYGGGEASLSRNADAAGAVLKQAGADVAAQRAQIAATRKYALEADESMLLSELEGYVRAESFLRDQDMAEGITELVRAKLVTQAGTHVLRSVFDVSRAALDLLPGAQSKL